MLFRSLASTMYVFPDITMYGSVICSSSIYTYHTYMCKLDIPVSAKKKPPPRAPRTAKLFFRKRRGKSGEHLPTSTFQHCGLGGRGVMLPRFVASLQSGAFFSHSVDVPFFLSSPTCPAYSPRLRFRCLGAFAFRVVVAVIAKSV